MKKLLYSLTAIAVIVSGCLKETRKAFGDWEPMELSTDELVFDSNGGEEEIICFNYNAISVDLICDHVLNQYYYRYRAKDPDSPTLDAPGISVSSKNGKIMVSVDPSSEKRRWHIGIGSGDIGERIDVYQNDAPKK